MSRSKNTVEGMEAEFVSKLGNTKKELITKKVKFQKQVECVSELEQIQKEITQARQELESTRLDIEEERIRLQTVRSRRIMEEVKLEELMNAVGEMNRMIDEVEEFRRRSLRQQQPEEILEEARRFHQGKRDIRPNNHSKVYYDTYPPEKEPSEFQQIRTRGFEATKDPAKVKKILYRTTYCRNGPTCDREHCNFYHCERERRIPLCPFEWTCAGRDDPVRCGHCHPGQEDAWLQRNPLPEGCPQERPIVEKKKYNPEEPIKLSKRDFPAIRAAQYAKRSFVIEVEEEDLEETKEETETEEEKVEEEQVEKVPQIEEEQVDEERIEEEQVDEE